jgi:putative IMPACT (imprinted ancient) family translation regulator
VRAYTDAVAQALLTAEKIPLIKQAHLACSVPYALEGLVRRELELAQAQLKEVSHGSVVTLHWTMPETDAPALVQRLGDKGQGQLSWLNADNAPDV